MIFIIVASSGVVDTDTPLRHRALEQPRLFAVFRLRGVEKARYLGALLVVEAAFEQRPENRRVDRLPVEPRRRHQIGDSNYAERQNVIVVEQAAVKPGDRCLAEAAIWIRHGAKQIAYIGKFVSLMASYDWSGEVEKIRCPTLVVIPGAETVGSLVNYDPFRRLADVEFKTYEGMPHNICDAVPDRCAAGLKDFLRRRFPG